MGRDTPGKKVVIPQSRIDSFLSLSASNRTLLGETFLWIERMSRRRGVVVILLSVLLAVRLIGQPSSPKEIMFAPLSYEAAEAKADSVLRLMTLEEKIAYVGGDRNFFIRPVPRLNLREVYMADATAGVHIRDGNDLGVAKYAMDKSTSFPAPICLAATWDPEISHAYARAIGEECRLGGIGILLGPGANEYRQAQCGRNFEYFGEDPYLRSRMTEAYVGGVQSTGTVATLKHFVANNTDFFRRKSNSIVDERALHEIYLPPYEAGIEAGAKAVMTSYNLLNGELCGESEEVINNLLRKQLGFQWLVMTDWWSVHDGEKLARSGQDLEMPYAIALKDAPALLSAGKITVAEIDRMAKSILRTYFAMKLGERERDSAMASRFPDHEATALQTAREGIVLLKNTGGILPLTDQATRILITGPFVDTLAAGGGSALVKGYDTRLMIDELKAVFGDRLTYSRNPSAEQIASADVVLCNVGTLDCEGWDRPFELPKEQEKLVTKCVTGNSHTVVIVTSGGGIRMTDWAPRAAAILYAWYGGQIGNRALAEIIDGETSPSGKLPITIEREFKDSPGYGYLPAGEKLYVGWNAEEEQKHPVYDVHYNEGIFVGYRWYEKKRIEPLFPFGHGLSYTTFEYRDLKVSKSRFTTADTVTVSFIVKNTGRRKGSEVAQLYVQDLMSALPRPLKELRGFQRVTLDPGESATVTLRLTKRDFSYWSTDTKDWLAERGGFVIKVGSSSRDMRLEREIELF